ncbi:MAG: virulence RhuM family protein [Syntrophales bacterium]|nr:virulence RhuM family protein [Syntrophales bacterium]
MELFNIFREEELERGSVVAFFATTAADGENHNVEFFNVDTVLSVGYRVNSKRGTQFRIRETKVLKIILLRAILSIPNASRNSASL